MEMTAEWIYTVLTEGSLGERQALVDRLPPHPFKATVRVLMDSSSPTTTVAALAALAQQYCFGSNPAVGAPLAAALHARGAEIMRAVPDDGLLTITLARLAFAHIRALTLLRRFDELMAVARDYLPARSASPAGRPSR